MTTVGLRTGAIRIGISSCLLGNAVRYDGSDKQASLLLDTLGAYFQWVPMCPEVEFGLGVPREPIQLVQRCDEIRLCTVHTGVDLTDRMRAFAKERVERLADEGLCGCILKKDSPSCGIRCVRVLQPDGGVEQIGTGLFAQALIDRLPDLPIEDEERLENARLRERWMERVFAYHGR